MKILKSLAVAGSIWAGAGLVASPSSAAPDPNFHIYIAFGQSNMAGASAAQEPETKPYPRFKLLPSMDCPAKGRTMGVWTDATSQLANCDNPPSISVADYFGRTMVDSLPDVT
ncbi:MAG: carbohydrate-binding protein, partial [Fibrobacter sp.]|nr:carbohydrate-binding protein [Fibrobacter sp.]